MSARLTFTRLPALHAPLLAPQYHVPRRPYGRRQPVVAPRAVEGVKDEMVIIPWSAEESWSDEAHERMDQLIARFQAADKDG